MHHLWMPKVRTLAGRCLDLRFDRPTAAVLKNRMRQIANAENLSVSDETLSKIAEVSGELPGSGVQA